MAYQISFTDPYGNTNPQSYWRVMFLAVDLHSGSARAELHGWKDKAAHDAGKAAIGTRAYTVSGQAFADYMTQYQAPSGNTDLFALAYTVAMNTQDVDDGNGGKVSFFANATEV